MAVNVIALGLDPVAAAFVGLLGIVNAVFQHANQRTPRALAWLVQRPEAHSIHRAVHGWNYSDTPLWDLLFGTYHRVDGFAQHVGFGERESRRWFAMATMRDVHEPEFELPRAATRMGA
ncbi:MAG TPA: sterol desaturase family protein [Rubrivivax sp.]